MDGMGGPGGTPPHLAAHTALCAVCAGGVWGAPPQAAARDGRSSAATDDCDNLITAERLCRSPKGGSGKEYLPPQFYRYHASSGSWGGHLRVQCQEFGDGVCVGRAGCSDLHGLVVSRADIGAEVTRRWPYNGWRTNTVTWAHAPLAKGRPGSSGRTRH